MDADSAHTAKGGWTMNRGDVHEPAVMGAKRIRNTVVTVLDAAFLKHHCGFTKDTFKRPGACKQTRFTEH